MPFEPNFQTNCPKLIRYYCGNNALALEDDDIKLWLCTHSIALSQFQTIDMSFNPLEDMSAALFLEKGMISAMMAQMISRFEEDKINTIISHHGLRCALEILDLQGTAIGNKCALCMATLAGAGLWPRLKVLSLGANQLTKVGVEVLLEATRDSTVLKSFSIPLNDISNDGICMLTSAILRGHCDALQEINVSDCGACLDSVNLLARAIQERAPCMKPLRRLTIFGQQPFPGRAARQSFSKEFLSRVKVA